MVFALLGSFLEKFKEKLFDIIKTKPAIMKLLKLHYVPFETLQVWKKKLILHVKLYLKYHKSTKYPNYQDFLDNH